MAGSNETVFEFTAKDQVTPVIGGLLTALGNLNTKVAGDKSMQNFEKNLAGAAQKSGVLTASIQGQAKAVGTASTAQEAYIKNLRKISELSSQKTGTTTTLPGGQVTGAGGFLNKGQIEELRQAETATRALASSQQLMKSTAMAGVMRDTAKGVNEYAASMTPAAIASRKYAADSAALTQRLQNVPPPSMRYALYDVSNSLAILGGALVVGGVAAFKFATSFEDAFADVKRTVDPAGLIGGFDGLQKSLVDMSTRMPVAFTELSKIASLGGQMGIDSKGIVQFTSTVARLGAVTDLSLEEAATALGRFKALLNIDEGEFEALGSAITKVGINSVATEGQIVRISTQIASMANFAGFTADQVIGLSGALASIGVPPELSRGVVTRLFNNMSKAVSKGGAELTRLGQLSGVSAEEFRSSWGNEQFADVFVGFVNGIREEGGKAVSTLVELGTAGVRDIPVLLRLAGAADSAGVAGGLLTQTMKDGKTGWSEATNLAEQYTTRMDTVAKRGEIFGNTMQAVFAGLGEMALGPASGVLTLLTDMARGFVGIMDIPVLGEIASIALGLITLVGALTLVAAASTRAYAGFLGMQQALGGMMGNVALAQTGLVRMAVTMSAAPTLMGKVAAGARGIGTAVNSMLGPVGWAILAITAVMTIMPMVTDGLTSAAGRADGLAGAMDRLSDSGKRASGAFDISSNVAGLEQTLANVPSWLLETTRAFEDSWFGGKSIPMVGTGIVRDIKMVDDGLAGLISGGNLVAATNLFNELKAANKNLTDDELIGVLNATDSALTEHGVVLEITEDGLVKVKYAADGVNSALSEEAAVAEAAGTKLVEFTDELTKASLAFVKTSDLVSGQQKARTEEAKNRIKSEIDAAKKRGDTEAETALQADNAWQQYYDGQAINLETYLADQAAAIAKQDEWEAGMQKLADMGVSDSFLQDLARLGPESAPLVDALISGSADQLKQAQEQFAAAGEGAALGFAVALAVNTQIAVDVAGQIGKDSGAEVQKNFLADVAAGRKPFVEILKQYGFDALGNPIPVAASFYKADSDISEFIRKPRSPITVEVKSIFTQVGDPGANRNGKKGDPWYASGGYTGSGGKFEPAGTVHKGEFVMTKEATSRIGVSNLYSMMRGSKNATAAPASNGYAGGGFVSGGGSSVMQLSPYDRSLLRNLRPVVNIGNRRVAASANAGNANDSRMGSS